LHNDKLVTTRHAHAGLVHGVMPHCSSAPAPPLRRTRGATKGQGPPSGPALPAPAAPAPAAPAPGPGWRRERYLCNHTIHKDAYTHHRRRRTRARWRDTVTHGCPIRKEGRDGPARPKLSWLSRPPVCFGQGSSQRIQLASGNCALTAPTWAARSWQLAVQWRRRREVPKLPLLASPAQCIHTTHNPCRSPRGQPGGTHPPRTSHLNFFFANYRPVGAS
jgi:hypothetical protein